MAKSGLIYDAAGDVVGHVFVSQDDDLALQEAPAYLAGGIVEVATDHNALTNLPMWTVVDDDLPLYSVTSTLTTAEAVPASSTRKLLWESVLPFSSASNYSQPIAAPVTFWDITVTIKTAQPASGSLVVTVYSDETPTAITVTVPAGSAAETTHRSPALIETLLTVGGYVQYVNNATGESGLVAGHMIRSSDLPQWPPD